MNPKTEKAILKVLKAWEDPRMSLSAAIYQLKRIYMAEVMADLKKPKMERPRKIKK